MLPSCILSIVLGAVFFENIIFLIYMSLYIVVAFSIYFLGVKREKKIELSQDDEKFLQDLAANTFGVL